ncbi:MAG: DUF1989 domain-containing protein, partial [Candidatus Limnocylindrales bacterium]
MVQHSPTPGRNISDQVIPPREYLGLELRAGQTLRIVDVEGKQVPDLVCFDLANPRVRSSSHLCHFA